jgi:hypothetical protein
MQEANLAKTPKYFKKTYNIPPNQEVQDVLPVCYGVNLATISPLYGLGFVEFSLDSGNYLPISYMPVYMPFQRITLRNTHPNQTFTVELVYILEPNAEVLGTFNYVYQQFNLEFYLTVASNVSFSSSTTVNYGPFYIGTRSQVRVVANFASLGSNEAEVYIYNSDAQGNAYEGFPGNVATGSINNIVIDVAGWLLAPYVLIPVKVIVASGTVTLNYLILSAR